MIGRKELYLPAPEREVPCADSTSPERLSPSCPQAPAALDDGFGSR